MDMIDGNAHRIGTRTNPQTHTHSKLVHTPWFNADVVVFVVVWSKIQMIKNAHTA